MSQSTELSFDRARAFQEFGSADVDSEEVEIRRLDCWDHLLSPAVHPAQDLRWLTVLENALRHRPFVLEARRAGKVVGILPLAEVNSLMFGSFLVSLPYINSGGVRSEDRQATDQLIDNAAKLTDELDARYLELRHESPIEHVKLTHSFDSKVHMRLSLPSSTDDLWDGLKAKVRNQIRKGEKPGFQVCWGQHELLNDFYQVFSRNMRDLGTPVYGKLLFAEILAVFSDTAELCCIKSAGKPVAAALLVHGQQITEVPSASSLREYNSSNVNMLLYWHLLRRAVERASSVFDFGRSTKDSNTYRFKKQWGATPSPAVWQYRLRKGSCGALRPESGKFSLAIRAWQKLPLPLTRWLGPLIVRGIP